MNAFAEDKSQWNIGQWNYLIISKSAWISGANSPDTEVVNRFPEKYVYRHPLGNWAYMAQVCGEVANPCIVWDIVHYDTDQDGVYGLYDLTESEQENAMMIEDVYFQNQYIYVVAKELPCDRVVIRLKGA